MRSSSPTPAARRTAVSASSSVPAPAKPARARRTAATPAPALSAAAAEFGQRLDAWYRANARDLPWRGIKNPYGTWVSEIMLQQTRVAAVMLRYGEFLARFPTLQHLAEADEADVLAVWSGLGYYRRARMLHRGAQFVVQELGGRLPRTAAQLRTLPGIGEYTAAAIASIAFGEPIAVLDGNVERVLLRLIGSGENPSAASRAQLTALAQSLVPVREPSAPLRTKAAGEAPTRRVRRKPGDHNQAMMELGATVCLPRAPLCLVCPVASLCITRGEHVTAPRARAQSRLAAYLLALRKRGVRTEVLLHRRPADASQMPAMLELPSLPEEATLGREPVLRLRHSITNTNYYVQIFAEAAPGVAPQLDAEQDDALAPSLSQSTATARPAEALLVADELLEDDEPGDDSSFDPDEEPFVASPELALAAAPLPGLLPLANSRSTEWYATAQLGQLPLTGLARKALQRLGVLTLPPVQIS